jgi:hypothetical protein
MLCIFITYLVQINAFLYDQYVSHIYYKQINTWAFPYWPGYHPETIYYIPPTSRKETPTLARWARSNVGLNRIVNKTQKLRQLPVLNFGCI